MSLNRATLLGNVGADPSIYRSPQGEAKRWVMATFPLATNEKGYTTADGRQIPERTDWHNIVLSNSLADVAERYVKKGDRVYIEGSLRTRKYTDQQGVERVVTEIYGTKLELLGASQRSGQPLPPPAMPNDLMNELP